MHAVEKVVHEVSRQVKRSRYADLLDVILNIRFGLEVRNMLETAVCDLSDMQQRGENQMLDSDFLGSVCDVFALVELDFVFCAFPVIGHEEDSVRALESLGDGGFVTQISLCDVSFILPG